MLGLLGNYKLILIKIAATLAVLAVVYGVAVVRTNADCKVNAATAQIKGVQYNEKTRQEVTGLSDPDLDKRLSRWVHD